MSFSGWVGFWFVALLYFVPTLIAIQNRKRNSTAIFALNLLAGCTFVGWVVALVWSLTHDPEDD